MAKTKEAGFEASLASLEQIVARLESGELPLEHALELFEEGVSLSRRCQSQLEEAERKVELLLREHGEIKTVPFDSSKEMGSSETDTSQRFSFVSPAAKAAAARADASGDDEIDDVVPF
jgi:exodeoxyribonuclease VII small subunit